MSPVAQRGVPPAPRASDLLSIAQLTARHAHDGRIIWIGVRPARRAPMVAADRTELTLDGLAGDHARAGTQALTLIQAEHLPAISSLAAVEAVPQALRRNVLVAGLNLAALRGETVSLGSATVRLTGPCHPCSRMEEALGPGGYNAMRGHGGWYAEVVQRGSIAVGDVVTRVDGPDAPAA